MKAIFVVLALWGMCVWGVEAYKDWPRIKSEDRFVVIRKEASGVWFYCDTLRGLELYSWRENEKPTFTGGSCEKRGEGDGQ